MKSIVFIGMMGTWKTAVSTVVAERLTLPLKDTDAIFESRFGKIDEFFTRYGEPAFRVREAAIVREVAEGGRSVISTGGGVVLDVENVKALRACGVVVLLTASPRAIAARVGAGEHRPLLQGDTMSNIVRIIDERSALYAAAADMVIDNTDMTVEQCVAETLRLLAGGA